jgi:hypothetical protein
MTAPPSREFGHGADGMLLRYISEAQQDGCQQTKRNTRRHGYGLAEGDEVIPFTRLTSEEYPSD